MGARLQQGHNHQFHLPGSSIALFMLAQTSLILEPLRERSTGIVAIAVVANARVRIGPTKYQRTPPEPTGSGENQLVDTILRFGKRNKAKSEA